MNVEGVHRQFRTTPAIEKLAYENSGHDEGHARGHGDQRNETHARPIRFDGIMTSVRHVRRMRLRRFVMTAARRFVLFVSLFGNIRRN